MNYKVVVLMGSKRDLEFCRKIAGCLKALKLDYSFRVASAHKTPGKVLEILEEHKNQEVVYITVAGRSNALSALVDANTTKPVIACPPYSEKFGGADIYSSLRVPSGIGSVVTVEPEGAALAAAKILAIRDPELERRILHHQDGMKRTVEEADEAAKKLK